jgi:hypothetical protein
MKKNKKMKNQIDAHRAVQGLLRKRHFETNGTLADWRGRSNVYKDRKKAAAKRACRGKVQW